MEAVIRAAERRMLWVLVVEQAAIALSIVLCGGILLLLLGTQLLDWYWLALLGAAGIGFAVIRVRARARPVARYRLAQILDRRLQLSDALSTAWFLRSQARSDDAVARFQLARADEIARGVEPARAFPFSGRRAWALSGALAALAFGLFAVRYLVTSSLSLQQALVPIHLGRMFEAFEQTLSIGKSSASGALANDSRAERAPSAHSEQRDEKNSASTPQDAQSGGNPAGAAPGAATAQNGGAQTDSTEFSEGKSPNGPPAGSEPQQQPAGNESASRESAAAKEQGTAGQQASSGTLDKMKDALASLMAKMRRNAGAERTAREGERPDPSQKTGDQMAAGKDSHGTEQKARSDQGTQQQSTEGQAQGQTTERAQASQGRSSESADRKGSDSQSGAGHQDGEKAIKEAEQQQAMGKLAEIIGKRSAGLTGDMTVETRSGKQQLQTEYSSRMGRHADLGGEINRDEIPLMYQQYIRDYMEAVRKQQQRSQ